MKKRLLAVISVLVLVSMMSLSVCAQSPSIGPLRSSQENNEQNNQDNNNQNNGVQPMADVDDDISTISEQIIAADFDTEELPVATGDLIAPDTGENTYAYLYIILAGLSGAIVLTYRKIKKA